MIFSPASFTAKGDFAIKGKILFSWSSVDSIKIDGTNKKILVYLQGQTVLLPLQENIFYLIKTFYHSEIINEIDAAKSWVVQR